MEPNTTTMYRCVTCVFACAVFSEAIDHLIINHPGLEMRLQKLISSTSSANIWQPRRFINIVPDEIKSQGAFIMSDNRTEKITISKLSDYELHQSLFDDTDSRSPDAKKQKISTSTPVKVSVGRDHKCTVVSVKSEEFNIVSDTESLDKAIEDDIVADISNMSLIDDHENDMELDVSNKINNILKQEEGGGSIFASGDLSSDEEEKDDLSAELRGLSLIDDNENSALLDELSQLLPAVLDALHNSNQKETFMKFARMVAGGQFPMNNIAYLLFMDVIEWFASDSTTNMRYSEDTKKFWRVGLKLFRGKFLRFMSGMKNKGQLTGETYSSGVYKPSDSQVNFAVPNRSVLDHMNNPIDASVPKVLTDMIDKINENDPKQVDSYKVCVDGKKINSGTHGQKLGDVNLRGFESSPSLEERISLYEKDIAVIHELQELLVLLQIQDFQLLEECSKYQKDRVSTQLKQVMSILRDRLRDLRTGSVGQNLALQKLLISKYPEIGGHPSMDMQSVPSRLNCITWSHALLIALIRWIHWGNIALTYLIRNRIIHYQIECILKHRAIIFVFRVYKK